jgi:hypothetical protein
MRNSIGIRIRSRSSMMPRAPLVQLIMVLLILCPAAAKGQMGTSTPLSPAERQKAAAEREATGALPNYPQLVDITYSTGIKFEHLSSPEAKFIAESMSEESIYLKTTCAFISVLAATTTLTSLRSRGHPARRRLSLIWLQTDFTSSGKER